MYTITHSTLLIVCLLSIQSSIIRRIQYECDKYKNIFLKLLL